MAGPVCHREDNTANIPLAPLPPPDYPPTPTSSPHFSLPCIQAGPGDKSSPVRQEWEGWWSFWVEALKKWWGVSFFNCSGHAQTAFQVRAASVGLDPRMTMALTPWGWSVETVVLGIDLCGHLLCRMVCLPPPLSLSLSLSLYIYIYIYIYKTLEYRGGWRPYLCIVKNLCVSFTVDPSNLKFWICRFGPSWCDTVEEIQWKKIHI